MKYRQFRVNFWTANDMLEFTPEQKYFYIYLFTNKHVNLAGLMEISDKVVALETGFNVETVQKLYDFMEEKGKVKRKGIWIWVVNFIPNQSQTSIKVRQGALNCLKECKELELVSEIKETYPKILDVEDKGDTETKKKKKDKKDKIPTETYKKIISHLNKMSGKRFRHSSKTARKYIRARMREGATIEDFLHVNKVKSEEWKGTGQEQYLRPATLYNSEKFEGYVNQKKDKATAKKGGFYAG